MNLHTSIGLLYNFINDFFLSSVSIFTVRQVTAYHREVIRPMFDVEHPEFLHQEMKMI